MRNTDLQALENTREHASHLFHQQSLKHLRRFMACLPAWEEVWEGTLFTLLPLLFCCERKSRRRQRCRLKKQIAQQEKNNECSTTGLKKQKGTNSSFGDWRTTGQEVSSCSATEPELWLLTLCSYPLFTLFSFSSVFIHSKTTDEGQKLCERTKLYSGEKDKDSLFANGVPFFFSFWNRATVMNEVSSMLGPLKADTAIFDLLFTSWWLRKLFLWEEDLWLSLKLRFLCREQLHFHS